MHCVYLYGRRTRRARAKGVALQCCSGFMLLVRNIGRTGIRSASILMLCCVVLSAKMPLLSYFCFVCSQFPGEYSNYRTKKTVTQSHTAYMISMGECVPLRRKGERAQAGGSRRQNKAHTKLNQTHYIVRNFNSVFCILCALFSSVERVVCTAMLNRKS